MNINGQTWRLSRISCKRKAIELVLLVGLQSYSRLGTSWRDFHRNSSRQKSVSVFRSIELEWCPVTLEKPIRNLSFIHFEYISMESKRENKLGAALHTNRNRNIFTSTGSISLVLNMARSVELGINASRTKTTLVDRDRCIEKSKTIPSGAMGYNCFCSNIFVIAAFARSCSINSKKPNVPDSSGSVETRRETRDARAMTSSSTNFSDEHVHPAGRFVPIARET